MWNLWCWKFSILCLFILVFVSSAKDPEIDNVARCSKVRYACECVLSHHYPHPHRLPHLRYNDNDLHGPPCNGNPANEIVDYINKNRTANKLPKLYDSPGLGCMALQYISECMGNCSSNNTLSCQPPEVDITEVYAPNCGVELPTVDIISGHLVGCQWKYLNPEQAFSQVLFSDKKRISFLHGKEHTEVGVGFNRAHHGPFFWCILFSSGKTNSTFVLEGGSGIKQKTGCFSGTDLPCSAGRKPFFLEDLVPIVFSVLLYFVVGV